MNLDLEIRRAQERLHRSIAQKVRYAKAEIRTRAWLARRRFEEPEIGIDWRDRWEMYA